MRQLYLRTRNQAGLQGICRRHNQFPAVPSAGAQCGQQLGSFTKLTAQGQFAVELTVNQSVTRELPACRKNADGDGQIESTPFLG